MSMHADNVKQDRVQKISNSESVAGQVLESAQSIHSSKPGPAEEGKLQLIANTSPNSLQFKKLQGIASRSPQVAQLQTLQKMADNSLQVKQLNKVQEIANGARQAIQMKGGNWGKLQSKVVGTRAKIGEQLDQAGTDESVREEATSETFRKRLSGGDWEDTNSYEEVIENGKPVKKVKLDEQGQKVKSKHQLTADERAGLKKYKGTAGLSEAYQDMARKHLKKFEKSHAFISEWAFGNILNVWKAWGADANFVSPLAEADAFFKQAVDGEGIATLERVLGIGSGAWSNKGQTSTIYRFIVNDPEKFNLRLPSGAENQAYQEEWLSGGKTLGGGSEAVIKNMTLEDLRESVSSGAIEIQKVTFIGKGNVEQSKVSSI